MNRQVNLEFRRKNSTVNRALALHARDLGLNSSSPQSPPSTARSNFLSAEPRWCRAFLHSLGKRIQGKKLRFKKNEGYQRDGEIAYENQEGSDRTKDNRITFTLIYDLEGYKILSFMHKPPLPLIIVHWNQLKIIYMIYDSYIFKIREDLLNWISLK